MSLPSKTLQEKGKGGAGGAGRRKEERHPLNNTIILYMVDSDKPFSLNSVLSITTIQKVM